MNQNNEIEEKLKFAELLLKTPDEPFKAALALFPDDVSRALWVAAHWPADPDVKAAQEEALADSGSLSFLPSKAELARDIWQRMQGTKTVEGRLISPDADDYAKLAKLYAEVMNFIEKPSITTNVNNVIVPKVIEIPNYGTAEEWENAATKQQRELLNVSRSRH